MSQVLAEWIEQKLDSHGAYAGFAAFEEELFQSQKTDGLPHGVSEQERYKMKCHKWTDNDEGRLLNAIDECEPLFDHYKQQGESYNEMNVWDAIAGRMLPLTVTGAACRRHFVVMNERDAEKSGWEKTAEMVEEYERSLAEETNHAVNNLMKAIEMLAGAVESLQSDIRDIKKAWE